MAETDQAYFESIPWCAKLIQSPEFAIAPSFSRTYKPSTEDSFFAETLKTENTIKAAISLYKRPTPEHSSTDEVRIILSLGSGMNGNPHVCHGGAVAAMMDDAMGVLLTLYKDANNRPLSNSTVTASLNVSYLQLVATPQVVQVVAKFGEIKGRKFYINAQIEDGEGTVLSRAESLWIKTAKTKLKL